MSKWDHLRKRLEGFPLYGILNTEYETSLGKHYAGVEVKEVLELINIAQKAEAESSPTKTVVENIWAEIHKIGIENGPEAKFATALAEAVEHIVDVSNTSDHDGPCKPSCVESVLAILRDKKSRILPK